jgi:hypothetical protein
VWIILVGGPQTKFEVARELWQSHFVQTPFSLSLSQYIYISLFRCVTLKFLIRIQFKVWSPRSACPKKHFCNLRERKRENEKRGQVKSVKPM